jgi:hypothetical protein
MVTTSTKAALNCGGMELTWREWKHHLLVDYTWNNWNYTGQQHLRKHVTSTV